MKQFIRSRYNLFFFLGALLFAVSSCNKDMSVSLGNPSEDMGVALIDTFTAQTSTVQLEYIPTSNRASIMVGKSTQAQIGTTTASSYFRVALPNFTDDIPVDAVFDSINLVLRPNSSRYYYGDTTQNQTIRVHRVIETIEPKNFDTGGGVNLLPIYATASGLFSDQKFQYENTALGTLTFAPRIRSIDTLNIRLNNALGKEIFDMINNNSPEVASNDNFQQYLKGLVIVPDDQNSAIISLNDTISMDINYSYVGTNGLKTTGKKTITTGSRSFQFNNIAYDRTGTAYAGLNNSNREILSAATNGNIFLQGGTGVAAKIDFPSLKEFLYQPNIAINKIELVVETTGTNTGDFPNPNSLMLYIGNKYTNTPISFIQDLDPRNPAGTLLPGNGFGKNSKYIFNLINYIKTLNDVANNDRCLYLSTIPNNLSNTTNMAMIAKENNKPKVKLNIVYTKFK